MSLELAKKNNVLVQAELTLLKDKTLAIDADILLRKVSANPFKSLQEGHATLDMTVQSQVADIIRKFKYISINPQSLFHIEIWT